MLINSRHCSRVHWGARFFVTCYLVDFPVSQVDTVRLVLEHSGPFVSVYNVTGILSPQIQLATFWKGRILRNLASSKFRLKANWLKMLFDVTSIPETVRKTLPVVKNYNSTSLDSNTTTREEIRAAWRQIESVGIELVYSFVQFLKLAWVCLWTYTQTPRNCSSRQSESDLYRGYFINNNHNSDIVQSQGFKHRITEMEKMGIFRLIFWDVYFA